MFVSSIVTGMSSPSSSESCSFSIRKIQAVRKAGMATNTENRAPILAAPCTLTSTKAWALTNRATVRPIPEIKETTSRWRSRMDSGRLAPHLWPMVEKRLMPIALPRKSAERTIQLRLVMLPNSTPALTKAKKNKPKSIGLLRVCSKLFSGDSFSFSLQS